MAGSLLGRKVQLVRQNNGLTQQELATRAGVSLSTVSKIEEGAVTRPSAKILAKLVRVLNYDLDELLNDEPIPKSLPRPRPVPKTHGKAQIKFVYFDIGGVLVHTESLILHHLSSAIHRPFNQVSALYYRYIPLAHRGRLSLDDVRYLMLLKLNIHYRGAIKRALFRDWIDYTESNPPAQQLAGEIAKTYPIGLLTNISEGGVASMRKKGLLPKLSYKAVVESWKVGFIKPEPEMFAVAAKAAGYPPAQILLIDDRKENVKGAIASGWQAEWFNELDATGSILRIKREYFS